MHKIPVFLAAMSWLVPGLGHFLQGKKYRAVLFFVTVGLLFWIGIITKAYIVVPGSPAYNMESFALFKFLGALGSGLHFFLAMILQGDITDFAIINSLKAQLTNEYATTCLYTAGIINILAIVDSIDLLRGKTT